MNANVVQQMSSFVSEEDDFIVSAPPERSLRTAPSPWIGEWKPLRRAASDRWFLTELAASQTVSAQSLLLAVWKYRFLQQDKDLEIQISGLQRHYVVNDAKMLSDFLRRHRALSALLLEMKEPLNRFFGQDSIWILDVEQDGNDFSLIRLAVRWRESLEDANAALRAFDENYWIDNCGRSSGNLVVTFDLV